jgi:hypothetical protein
MSILFTALPGHHHHNHGLFWLVNAGQETSSVAVAGKVASIKNAPQSADNKTPVREIMTRLTVIL